MRGWSHQLPNSSMYLLLGGEELFNRPKQPEALRFGVDGKANPVASPAKISEQPLRVLMKVQGCAGSAVEHAARFLLQGRERADSIKQRLETIERFCRCMLHRPSPVRTATKLAKGDRSVNDGTWRPCSGT